MNADIVEMHVMMIREASYGLGASWLDSISKTTAIRSIWLYERLASLGIMGTQFRTPLKPIRPSQHYVIGGFKWGSLWVKEGDVILVTLRESGCASFQPDDHPIRLRNNDPYAIRSSSELSFELFNQRPSLPLLTNQIVVSFFPP